MRLYRVKAIFFVLIFIVAIYFYFLIDPISTSKEQEILSLKQSIISSTVHCYAVEGSYPPNINYLKKSYGLYFDESKYIVIYDSFADNVMPNIIVNRIS